MRKKAQNLLFFFILSGLAWDQLTVSTNFANYLNLISSFNVKGFWGLFGSFPFHIERATTFHENSRPINKGLSSQLSFSFPSLEEKATLQQVVNQQA